MDEQRKPPSVMDALDASMARTKRILFAPFDAGKWFALGFCAFLAQLGQGGGYTGGNPFGGGAKNVDVVDKVEPWVMGHLALVLSVGAAVLLFALALGILLTWLSSRGEFMFLDGVVRDRGAVSEPWQRFRRQGNSLFVFRVVLGLAGFALVLLIIGLGLLVAWPAVRERHFDVRSIAVMLGGGCLLILVALALILVKVLLRDFVVPIMYRRDIAATEAFQVFRGEVLPGRVGNFVLFYLMGLVIGLAAAVLIVVGTCITCCIAALPYISSVVFLPILVFFRAYSISFLEQCGDEWHLTGSSQQPPLPPALPPEPATSPSPKEPGPDAVPLEPEGGAGVEPVPPSGAPDLPSPSGPPGAGPDHEDRGPIVPMP